jgi:hypothetical protein
MFHGGLAVVSSIFGYFADNGHKTSLTGLSRKTITPGYWQGRAIGRAQSRCHKRPIVRAIAPNTEPMLDSGSMCASASKLFAASRSTLLPGSLALLLLRR